jgi:NAD(P)-dependent dehydrogenase (short-subunit alcohol dehydrogenase family)
LSTFTVGLLPTFGALDRYVLTIVTLTCRSGGYSTSHGDHPRVPAIALGTAVSSPKVSLCVYAFTVSHRVPKITTHYADVGKKSEVDQSIREVLGAHDEITNLVTCAGYCQNVEAIKMTSEEIKTMLGVNLEGTFYCATEIARYLMARNKPGNMIFIGSISGSIVNVPQPQAMYNSSKAAVRHLAASLAVEWASKGIRVNCLSPGYMITEQAMCVFGLK